MFCQGSSQRCYAVEIIFYRGVFISLHRKYFRNKRNIFYAHFSNSKKYLSSWMNVLMTPPRDLGGSLENYYVRLTQKCNQRLLNKKQLRNTKKYNFWLRRNLVFTILRWLTIKGSSFNLNFKGNSMNRSVEPLVLKDLRKINICLVSRSSLRHWILFNSNQK